VFMSVRQCERVIEGVGYVREVECMRVCVRERGRE
jgi:hypothetical protein